MPKMYDAGEIYNDSEMKMLEPGSKNKKYYPHIDLNSKNLPEIKDMKVGKKYIMTIEVKPIRFSINESEGSEKKASMCFEVSKVGLADDQDSSMEKDEKMDKMVEKMYPEKKK